MSETGEINWPSAVDDNINGGDKCCCPRSPQKPTTMNPEMTSCAGAGDINRLYCLIKKVPQLLKDLDEIQFVHTPLHKAAECDQANFAVEIMNLMPSFGKKLNTDGLSPLHLAVEMNSVRTAKALVKIDRELIRIKGKEGMTSLHYAAKHKYLDLLASFLLKCPESIKDRNVRSQTAIHVALEHNRHEAFKLLLGWMSRKESNNPVLGWKDENGNTALHLVVPHDIYFKEVGQMVSDISILDILNSEDKTPLDVAQDHGSEEMVNLLKVVGARTSKEVTKKEALSKYLKSPITRSEAWSRDNYAIRIKVALMSNILLVIAVLMVTATYQAVLQPPGGLYQASAAWQVLMRRTKTGKMVMTNQESKGFLVANTGAFMISLLVIMKVFSVSTRGQYALLHMGLLFLACSYIVAVNFIAEASAISTITMAFSIIFIFFTYAGITAEELEAMVAGTRKQYSYFLRQLLMIRFPALSTRIRRQNKINQR